MILRRPAIVVLIAALLAVAALLSIRRLKIDTSLASLFDEHDPAARALVRVLDHFSAVEELLVLVESPADQPAHPDQLTAFAARLEKSTAADPQATQSLRRSGVSD
jgi:predicted RND superfamily exporter protein